MPTCNWSLLCAGADEEQTGSVHADDDANLVVTFESGGKVSVAPGDDGKTITVEGDLTLRRIGDRDLRFVGSADIDASGATGISGKLVFEVSKNVSLELGADVDPQSGEVRAGGTVAIRF
jgi:hypothetical protein